LMLSCFLFEVQLVSQFQRFLLDVAPVFED